MSKVIVMQTNVKLPTRAVEILNKDSLLILKIEKKIITVFLRKLAIVSLFIALAISLIHTYQSANTLFWSLFKASLIIGLFAFLSIKSNTVIKTKSK